MTSNNAIRLIGTAGADLVARITTDLTDGHDPKDVARKYAVPALVLLALGVLAGLASRRT